MMLRIAKSFEFASVLLSTLLYCSSGGATEAPALSTRVSTQEAVQREVDIVRKTYDIPAMTVAVWQDNKQVIRLTRGQRAADSAVLATNDDLWHLGSCGKAMTAVMILRLVDRGVLRLDVPIVTYLPTPLQSLIHPTLRQATLAQLLSHTSGLFDEDWRNTIKGNARSRFPEIADPAEREMWQAVSIAVERKPEHAPGEAFQYSNMGYMLAGFIAAQAAQKPWEQLMREEVFQPLGMTSANFGLPGSEKVVDQPRGHEHGWKWLVVPTTKVIAPNKTNTDPTYYGPAGLIHMSMQDWAVFLRMMLAGYCGQSRFLSMPSFARLLTPVKSRNFSEYGLGMQVTKTAGSNDLLLTHTGSNGFWRARFHVDTSRKRIAMMAANLGDDSVDKAFVQIAKTIDRELR
jgi:CubicO group peptidase (beta-lactamase class C family)